MDSYGSWFKRTYRLGWVLFVFCFAIVGGVREYNSENPRMWILPVCAALLVYGIIFGISFTEYWKSHRQGVFVIKSGRSRCVALKLPHFGIKRMRRKITLNESCWYYTEDGVLGKTKIFGFGLGGWYPRAHHKNSLRLAYLPVIVEGEKMFELYSYCYNGGPRRERYLCTVSVGSFYVDIDRSGNENLMTDIFEYRMLLYSSEKRMASSWHYFKKDIVRFGYMLYPNLEDEKALDYDVVIGVKKI